MYNWFTYVYCTVFITDELLGNRFICSSYYQSNQNA